MTSTSSNSSRAEEPRSSWKISFKWLEKMLMVKFSDTSRNPFLGQAGGAAFPPPGFSVTATNTRFACADQVPAPLISPSHWRQRHAMWVVRARRFS